MICYTLEAAPWPDGGESWADAALGALRYNDRPEGLQAAIQSIYEQAAREVRVDGMEVRSGPLFAVLGGKTAGDYVQRVEPSVEGGREMAAMLLQTMGVDITI